MSVSYRAYGSQCAGISEFALFLVCHAYFVRKFG